MTTAEYELTSGQNEVVERFGRRARMLGGISTAGGVLCLLTAVLGIRLEADASRILVFLLAALPQLSVGLSFLGAGRSLVAVVETQGHDVTLLMDALGNLAVALRVQIAMTLVFLLLVSLAAAGLFALG